MEAIMPDDVIQQCRTLFDLIRRFWSSFGHGLTTVLHRTGINVPQYMTLVALGELGETTMGQLSRRLHVTMGAATNLVDKLIRGGYASRTRGTADRRVVKVKLQPQGQKVLRDVEEGAIQFMAGVLTKVEPERRRMFIESYGRMVAIVESQEAAAAFRAKPAK
jgi:DNA-binding MarR family transcriptional regulator